MKKILLLLVLLFANISFAQKPALVTNGGLIIDQKLGQIRQANANGVRVVVNNQQFTVAIATPIAVTFNANSVIYYNIITNTIEHSTATATGNNASHYEIARWNSTNNRWIGNETNVTYLLADANVPYNLNRYLYVTPNLSRRIIINLLTSTITLQNQLIYQFSDNLNTGILTADFNIDISSIPDNNVVYLYFDQTNNTFVASPHLTKPAPGTRNLYFITSFRKDATKTAVASFNQDAIRIVQAGEEVIKKVYALGDSLTQTSNWTGEFMRIYDKPITMINAGISGTTVTNVNANSMVNRINNMPVDTDLLLFFGGTNDNALPLGTIAPIGSVFDDATFYGAYQKTIETAYSINPKVRIILIATSRRFDGVNILPIVNATKEIGQLYSLPVVDLYNEMQVNELNQVQYLTDLLHLTTFGGSKIGRMVVDSVIRNF